MDSANEIHCQAFRLSVLTNAVATGIGFGIIKTMFPKLSKFNLWNTQSWRKQAIWIFV